MSIIARPSSPASSYMSTYSQRQGDSQVSSPPTPSPYSSGDDSQSVKSSDNSPSPSESPSLSDYPSSDDLSLPQMPERAIVSSSEDTVSSSIYSLSPSQYPLPSSRCSSKAGSLQEPERAAVSSPDTDLSPASRAFNGGSPRDSVARSSSLTIHHRRHNGILTSRFAEQDYAVEPSEQLVSLPEEVEKDDALHNPSPNDDFRDRFFWDAWNPRLKNLVALIVVATFALVLTAGLPAIYLTTKKWSAEAASQLCHPGDTLCLDVGPRPLLSNVRTGPIDPDTPESAKSKVAADGKKLKLVFSDEFNKEGRTFYDEDDPYFQAVDLWYGVTHDLEWYDPDAITTRNGALDIRFDLFRNHDLNYRSGMLQSWNKLCLTGGHIEASISLPGRGDVSGLWPGFWTMGNLGRAGYAATTDGTWPYSYHDECDVGITANQSQMDGLSWLPGMRLPACTCPGEDHPSPGKSRSSPELDVIEASVSPLNGDKNAVVGTVSQSLQLAPYDVFYMPNLDFAAVYNDKITHVNDWRGSPFQECASGLSNINNDWYDGKAYQTYGVDYTPGPDGAVTWYVGKDKTWTLDGRAIGANGNIGARVIPAEPMSIIMNLGMAENFAPIDKAIHELLPAFMRIDYIRVYQDPHNGNHSLTCDPPGKETTEYIKKHERAYSNANLTSWSAAGYEWPKNSFVHGCQ